MIPTKFQLFLSEIGLATHKYYDNCRQLVYQIDFNDQCYFILKGKFPKDVHHCSFPAASNMPKWVESGVLWALRMLQLTLLLRREQGWGSLFSKGTKFLIWGFFYRKAPGEKELSYSNELLLPNPGRERAWGSCPATPPTSFWFWSIASCSTREKAMTEKEGEITSGPEHHRSISSAVVELVEWFYILESKFTLRARL